MKRSLLVYAVALAVALFAAYYSWTHEGDPDLSEAVVILDGDVDDLEEVSYHSAKIDVTLSMREDDLGRYAWVNVVPKPAGEEPPPPDPANPHAPPPPDVDPAQFKAGKTGDTVLEGLAPFRAKRVLEGVDDLELGELGLENPETSLTIKRKGKDAKTYEIGDSAYGGANAYVRDPSSGTIYIVDVKVLRPLRSGKRTLPDRDLVGLQIKEIARVDVRGGEANVSFEQHNPDDADAQFWSIAGESEASPTGAAWLDKLLRLRSAEYLGPESEPQGLEEAFSFSVVGNKQAISVTVYRATGADGEDAWYARSQHTRSLVKLHLSLAAEVFADLQSALEAGQST